MDRRIAFLSGLGIGAGAMFLLDPDRGRRRRALVRDQAVRVSNTSREALEKTARDLRNRAIGVVAETRAMFGEGEVTDQALVDRVRAYLGRFPVHDGAFAVGAEGGVVTLSGDALASELETILDAVNCVRGVKDVVNNLVVHESADGISALQGNPRGADGATAH